MLRWFWICCATLVLSFGLAGCGETLGSNNNTRILVMGDSLLATNRLAGKAVSNSVETALNEPVVDRAIPGARYFGVPQAPGSGLWIPGQFIDGAWDWVILNGYGNDVMFGCGCGSCERTMDRLISADGQTGAIPDLIRDLRAKEARVIYVGYLRSPGFVTPVESCAPRGDELDRRIALFAQTDRGVTFLSNADLVPEGDRSFHGLDLIHPSYKGSAAIGQRVAAIIAGG